MKRFEQLTNKDKAYNLHVLFPGEIGALLTYVQGTAKAIAGKDENKYDQATADMFSNISPSELKTVANEVSSLIDSFFHLMADNAQFFAEQLFEEKLCHFVIGCLIQYGRICPNQKIKQFIDLFFIENNN